jgi:hypothetical protein
MEIFVSDGLQSNEELGGPLNSLKLRIASCQTWWNVLAEHRREAHFSWTLFVDWTEYDFLVPLSDFPEVFSGYCKLNEEVIDLIGSLLAGFRGALAPRAFKIL